MPSSSTIVFLESLFLVMVILVSFGIFDTTIFPLYVGTVDSVNVPFSGIINISRIVS